jgi:hypothetical protein
VSSSLSSPRNATVDSEFLASMSTAPTFRSAPKSAVWKARCRSLSPTRMGPVWIGRS